VVYAVPVSDAVGLRHLVSGLDAVRWQRQRESAIRAEALTPDSATLPVRAAGTGAAVAAVSGLRCDEARVFSRVARWAGS